MSEYHGPKKRNGKPRKEPEVPTTQELMDRSLRLMQAEIWRIRDLAIDLEDEAEEAGERVQPLPRSDIEVVLKIMKACVELSREQRAIQKEEDLESLSEAQKENLLKDYLNAQDKKDVE